MPDYPGIPTRHKPVKVERGTSIPPSGKQDVTSVLMHHAKRWSPLGIVAALTLGYYALGGNDGVTRLLRAMSAEEALLAEIKGLRNDIATEREERAKILARLHATERNLSSLCDFVAEMNGGRPNKTWCSADSRAIRVDEMQSPPPFRTTGESWIYVE